MVVDDVECHCQSARVGGVDETLQGSGRRRFVHRVPEHAVVAPSVGAVERVERHEFDELDTEIHEFVETIDRRVERASGVKVPTCIS